MAADFVPDSYGSTISSTEPNTDKNAAKINILPPKSTNKRQAFLDYFRKNRRKVVATSMVFLDYIAFSWLYAITGPSLPELQRIVNVDLKSASWLFTCMSFGYMTGCGMHGAIHGRINNVLLLATYALLACIFWIATPWCRVFWVMIIVRFLGGIAIGGTDSAVHAQLFAVWGMDAGPFSQLLYVMLGVGGMLSALTVKHFVPSADMNELTEQNHPGHHLNTTLIKTPVDWRNWTESMPGNFTSASNTNPTTEIQIQWAFLIAGCVSLVSAVPLFVDYFLSVLWKGKFETFDGKHESEGNGTRKLDSKCMFWTSLVILACVCLLVTGLIDTYIGYLSSYLLRQLHWSKPRAAFATSIFYISFTVGNFLSMVLTLIISTRTLINVSILGATLSFICLTVSGYYLNDPGTWVGVVGCGLSLSPAWPAFFTYVEESVTPVSGKISSLFLFFGACGMFLHPLIMGYSMDTISPMCFGYVMLIEWALMALLYFTVFYMYRDKSEEYSRF